MPTRFINQLLIVFFLSLGAFACTSESDYYQQAVNFEAEANIPKALQAIEQAIQEQPQNNKYLSMKTRLLVMSKHNP